MTRIKNITVSNLKALSDFTANFNGCTAIITGGNNKGKSSLLSALRDRLRGIKPELILKQGEKEGYYEMELTTGEKLRWEFNNTTAAGEKLIFISEKNIKKALTKEIYLPYFPATFDVDKFLLNSATEQSKTLQKFVGIDFTDVDRRYQLAYDDRQSKNRLEHEERIKFQAMAMPEFIEAVLMETLLAEKDLAKKRFDELYQNNKAHNVKLRNDFNAAKEAAQSKYDAKCEEMRVINSKVENSRVYLKNLVELGYTGTEVEKWIETLPYQEVIKDIVTEPVYINELPDDSEITAIDEKINSANETNRLAQIYTDWLTQKNKHLQAKDSADKADANVKAIEHERFEMIKSAKMPEGFSFSVDGILYNGLPFTREQLSSSGIYIAALKLAAMTLGEVKTLHFDASFLDKNSLSDIEKWANENDLQLLIERPDFEGGEIEYHILETQN